SGIGRGAVSGPRIPRNKGTRRIRSTIFASEVKATKRTTVIKFVYASLPNFATDTELVLPDCVGENVGEMAGDVITAFRRRDAHLIKPRDGNVRCPENGLSGPQSMRAGKYTKRLFIESIVLGVED